MSIGMYIASYHKLKQYNSDFSSECKSLKELRNLGNYAKLLSDLKKNLGLEVKDIDPEEKLFVFLNESDESFSVKREKDGRTINRYTDKPFIYYVEVYSWNSFYEPFSDFLKTLNAPFELWRIWEKEYEIDDLKIVKLPSLEAAALEKTFGLYEYLDPILGIFE